jgi:ADP-heptose:LPS heptosyltransferase/SAM-dependent methyltransferase
MRHISRRNRSEHDRILIRFGHGLGDAVQLTSVLAQLRHYHPHWQIDVAALVGKHSCFNGLADHVYILGRDEPQDRDYDEVFRLDWWECRRIFPDLPSTKAEQCLRDIFSLQPREELCRYQIHIGEQARTRARAWLIQVAGGETVGGRFPVVLLHYEGNSAMQSKNLSHATAAHLCDEIQAHGYVPVVLDWDYRSSLPNGQDVFCPNRDDPIWGGSGTGDAEILAALIEQSALMIGIDSGPLHVAAATNTPTLAIWTGHHPIHYMGLADNVLHLVPEHHANHLHGDRETGLSYFNRRYRHRIYADLADAIAQEIQETVPRRVRRTEVVDSYGRAYFEQHRKLGINYAAYCDWQKHYGRWVVESLGLAGKAVLDVGCACGAIVRGLRHAGAVCRGVDLSEYMIQLGRNQWPELSSALAVCDAVNLHLYRDAAFDAIHSQQVAEHWRPEHVPLILRELARVTVPGGLFFCVLDTVECPPSDDDPTHICVRPMNWWHEMLDQAGWLPASDATFQAMSTHPCSFFASYPKWGWFLAERADT